MEYEVLCVEIDSSSDYDDCRCISKIGYKNYAKRKKTPRVVHNKIKNDDKFYIKEDGDKTYLEAKEREGTKYVRTESNDTKEDNLLKQQTCRW